MNTLSHPSRNTPGYGADRVNSIHGIVLIEISAPLRMLFFLCLDKALVPFVLDKVREHRALIDVVKGIPGRNQLGDPVQRFLDSIFQLRYGSAGARLPDGLRSSALQPDLEQHVSDVTAKLSATLRPHTALHEEFPPLSDESMDRLLVG